MTLLRDDTDIEPIAAPDVEVEAGVVVESRRTRSRPSWKRWVAVGVLAVLVAGLVVALFAGPVERIWYRNRQSHLASDMNHPRAGVAPGQAVAVLQIPRLDLNLVVVEGDNPERLRSGPGHRVSTPKPGTRGNSVIMGHRKAWGGPFARLDRLRRGDYLAVQTRAKKTVVYKVTSIARLGGGETSLLHNTKDYRLTLVTGRGGRFSDDRLVVTAISGRKSSSPASVRAVPAETPSQSVIFNLTILMAVVAFALALGAALYLRRRSGLVARVAVVLPLVVAGTLCLLLDLDLLLPPLK